MGVAASTPAAAAASARPGGNASEPTAAAPRGPPASSSAAVLSEVSADDSLAPHMARDLSHHILECPLLPGSGRAMRSHRVRHADSGSLLVVRATVIKYGSENAGGTYAAAGGSAA